MELAEILAEARRLEAAYLADQCLMSWDALISHQHGSFPRLARVAEAAMEMRWRPGVTRPGSMEAVQDFGPARWAVTGVSSQRIRNSRSLVESARTTRRGTGSFRPVRS